MADLTVQTISGGVASLGTSELNYAGLTPAAGVAAAGGGDTFTNDGRTFVEVVNGGGGTITVTVDQKKPDSQGRTFDPKIPVAAGGTRWFGPFEPGLFNDPITSKVSLAYSGVTSVTVRAFKLAERFAA